MVVETFYITQLKESTQFLHKAPCFLSYSMLVESSLNHSSKPTSDKESTMPLG